MLTIIRYRLKQSLKPARFLRVGLLVGLLFMLLWSWHGFGQEVPQEVIGAENGTGFVPSLGDVPLAPQLTIDSDSAVSFETADGRIAEIVGHLHETSDSITGALMRFYRETLPALGWQETPASKNISGDISKGETLRLRFWRDKESLQIDISANRQVIFRLQPL